MIIAGAQDLVHQIAIAGQENQPLGILVEPANGENPFTVADKTLDVVFLRAVGGADNTHRFVQGNEHQIFFVSRLHHLAVDLHHIPGQHLIAHLGPAAVDVHVALLDEPVGIPTGAHTALADVFVQSG